MARRNQAAYIRRCEADIDDAWKRLAILRRNRSAALLYLVTAVDDRLRLVTLYGGAEENQFMAVRYAQEALQYGIPWIIANIPAGEDTLPEAIGDVELNEGQLLAEYAYGYSRAVVGFSNFHKGLFTATAERGRPRIQFRFVDDAASAAENQRLAFLLEQHVDPEESRDDVSLMKLGEAVTIRARHAGGNRIHYATDASLIETMREVREFEQNFGPSQVPDDLTFATFSYGAIKRYLSSLAALSHAQELLHLSVAISGVPTAAMPSLTLRMSLNQLNDYLTLISELPEDTVAGISQLFTYDGSVPGLDPITQPLLLANMNQEVIVPRAFVRGSRRERNFLKLFAKHPLYKPEYDRFSSMKEGIAIPQFKVPLQERSLFLRERLPITEQGQRRTDADIVTFDSASGLLMVLQHKWLIEPDSINESRSCDEEISRGIRQGQIARDFLRVEENRLRLSIRESVRAVEAMVVVRGLEPTGFLRETDIPVITEDWFIRQLGEGHALAEIFEQAHTRPDRVAVVNNWTADETEVKLAGYTLVLPSISRPLPNVENERRGSDS
jgi:hypothetical protein